MKAMREALEDVTGLLESILETFSKGTGGVYMSDVAESIANARAALAIPIRNCDVVTAGEQEERFIDYCCGKCDGSKCKHALNIEDEIYKCVIKWEQMPYEAEEGESR